jgi:hypothetical protein
MLFAPPGRPREVAPAAEFLGLDDPDTHIE